MGSTSICSSLIFSSEMVPMRSKVFDERMLFYFILFYLSYLAPVNLGLKELLLLVYFLGTLARVSRESLS